MAGRSRLLAPALAMVLCAACSLLPGAGPRRSPAERRTRPVAVILEGSALDRESTRRTVVAAVRRATGRQVVVAVRPSPAADPQVKRLAARFTKENPGLATYDWREPHCAADAVVLTALRYDAVAVYRVSLDRSERTRPATETEVTAHPVSHAASRALAPLRLAKPGTVLEESISGTVVVSTFTAAGGNRRIGVARRVAVFEPFGIARRIRIGPLVAETLKDVPLPRDTEWEPVARRLLSTGCPFLALAIADVRPGLVSRHHGIRTAALGAMREDIERRAATRIATETSSRFETALQEGHLDTAASIVAQYAADPASKRDTVTELTHALEAARLRASTKGVGEGRTSCSALCAMHMVHICNRDRALWESHRKPWEQTACGTIRTEAFLKECYQQQWLSGAFHEGCIVPCERTAEGRERLIAILRGAGCRIRIS